MASQGRREHVEGGAAVVLYGAITAWLLRDVLFRSDRVLSADGLDLSAQYLPWSRLVARELGHGHVPLWNPHTFSGGPLLGNLQSAVLYPTTLFHLVLPPASAFNLIFALHVWLAGVLAWAFCRQRGATFPAALLGGATFQLSAPFAGHLYPGHAPYLSVMAWAPLSFLVAEKLLARPARGWLLVGGACVALELLGGYPQPAYNTAFLASVYLACRIPWRRRREMGGIIAAWVGTHVFGVLAAAPVLVAARAAAHESVRAGGASFDFATSFSLPPENLYTLLVPRLLGDNVHVDYVGGELLWEASLFVGVTSLVLAAIGAYRSSAPGARALGGLSVLCVVLALGRATPLFALLFHFVPGFDLFRVPTRFGYLLALFVGALAADGVDLLSRGETNVRRTTLVTCALAMTAAVAASVLAGQAASGGRGLWSGVLDYLRVHRRIFRNPVSSEPFTPAFVHASAGFAAEQLALLAVTLLVVATLLVVSWRWPRHAAVLLVLVGLGELAAFASAGVVWMPLPVTWPQGWVDAITHLPKDARTFTSVHYMANQGMLFGVDELGGYDPLVSRRYGQFLLGLGGGDPDRFRGDLSLVLPSKAFALLRCGALLNPEGSAILTPGGMPRAYFVQTADVVPDRDEAIGRFARAEFDPRTRVLLEEAPAPQPSAAGAGGTVSVTDLSTDVVEVVADVAEPSILVITDAYSDSFTIRALPDSAETGYRLLPADQVIRAVALPHGHHHFQMEYRPKGLATAWVVSAAMVLSWSIGGGLVALGWLRRRRARSSGRDR